MHCYDSPYPARNYWLGKIPLFIIIIIAGIWFGNSIGKEIQQSIDSEYEYKLKRLEHIRCLQKSK